MEIAVFFCLLSHLQTFAGIFKVPGMPFFIIGALLFHLLSYCVAEIDGEHSYFQSLFNNSRHCSIPGHDTDTKTIQIIKILLD